ncbi:MAG: hypothetical protein QOE92_144 [Chloroflexota bacterium]|jgi:hypothetical protein|nr:hypothetical protein [Chloroflexota bacterium]
MLLYLANNSAHLDRVYPPTLAIFGLIFIDLFALVRFMAIPVRYGLQTGRRTRYTALALALSFPVALVIADLAGTSREQLGFHVAWLAATVLVFAITELLSRRRD